MPSSERASRGGPRGFAWEAEGGVKWLGIRRAGLAASMRRVRLTGAPSTPEPSPEPAPEPFEPQPEPTPEPQPQPAPPRPQQAPAPSGAVPDTEPLPEPLFYGPEGPLYDPGTAGAPGPRIALFTDCPNGPNCREPRRKGVEAALALEGKGASYEVQRIVAEATFLAWLRDERRLRAMPTITSTLEVIAELAARGGRDAKLAQRLQQELLREEFIARGIKVGY